jgi:hypothetical protein
MRYSKVSNKTMISELWSTITVEIQTTVYVDGRAAHMTDTTLPPARSCWIHPCNYAGSNPHKYSSKYMFLIIIDIQYMDKNCLWFLGYIKQILEEAIKLRAAYPTLAKAKEHAKIVLPAEPYSLVQKYLEGKVRQSKEEVVAARHSRYTSPALPLPQREHIPCCCKGMCPTTRCTCRGNEVNCNSNCKCNKSKCKNGDWIQRNYVNFTQGIYSFGKIRIVYLQHWDTNTTIQKKAL